MGLSGLVFQSGSSPEPRPEREGSTDPLGTFPGQKQIKTSKVCGPLSHQTLHGAVRRVLWGVLATCWFTLPIAVAGQDTTRVVQLRGISVQIPRSATTTGGTSAVKVSLDSLQIVAAPTIEELLRRMPLIQIRSNSRGEAQPSLRGAEDRQIAILLDGIPLTLGWDHRTDLSVLPLTAVRNMTLLRGLSSILHGPNVLGGAIEFDIARGPTQQRAPRPFTFSAGLNHEGGRSSAVTVGTRLERDFSSWTLRGGAGYRERPGVEISKDAKQSQGIEARFLEGTDGRRLNSDRYQIDGFLSARYLGIGGTWFSGLVTAFDAERGVPPEAHVQEPRLWRYPNQSRAILAFSGGTGERQTSRGTGDLEFSLGFDQSEATIDEYDSEAYAAVIDGETSKTKTTTVRLLGDHTLGSVGEIRTALTLANVGHDEAFDNGTAFSYQQRLWSLGSEVELTSKGRFGVGSEGTTHWTMGGVIDGASTPKTGDKPALETLWDWGIRAGSTTTSNGGNVVLHWGLSRRTRFPSLRELYSGALGRFVPNPELRPETLKAVEAGITAHTQSEHQLQVVGFHHRLTDGIVRTRTQTQDPKFKRENRGEVRSTGLELLLSGGLARFSYGADLTLQRIRVRDTLTPSVETMAEYQPAISGKLTLNTSLTPQIFAGAFLRIRGSQYCQNPEADRLDQLGSSASLDVEVRRFFRPQRGPWAQATSIEASIGIDNLSDTAVFDQCGLPQPGRTLRLQFNFR